MDELEAEIRNEKENDMIPENWETNGIDKPRIEDEDAAATGTEADHHPLTDTAAPLQERRKDHQKVTRSEDSPNWNRNEMPHEVEETATQESDNRKAPNFNVSKKESNRKGKPWKKARKKKSSETEFVEKGKDRVAPLPCPDPHLPGRLTPHFLANHAPLKMWKKIVPFFL